MCKRIFPTNEEDIVVYRVLEALRAIRFGSIHLIVQDGIVVQIEKVEKFRFTR